MGIHFEEEIFKDILIRLPVRSLLRFSCVSKSWETSISYPYFKTKYLSHAKNDFNSQKLLVCQRQFAEDSNSNVYSMFSFYSSSLSTIQLIEGVRKHDCPSNCKPFGMAKIYSSCDVLVLLGIVSESDKQLLLWNPSTRESIVLPHSELLHHTTYGLAYDATSDDYKILKLGKSVEILTLKSGSWRTIREIPTSVCPRTGYEMEIRPCLDVDFAIDPVVFVHGAFHWLGRSHNYYVVSFSISSEMHGGISLPERMYKIDNMQSFDYGISVLGGMLCFYSTHNNQQGWGAFKLWVMKDYGVKESWTELFKIRDADLYLAKLIYKYADNEVLLRCRYKESGRDVFRTSKGPFGLWLQCSFQNRVVYTESFISPKLLF
ncbi:F-box protein CPR1-like [Nicotiana tabacum]|uniref:F-box protein CPR1-like n=1 Tax=Nicotiana tabacum TaxID=4097 RepID=A0AC58SAS8_TOBAC